MARQTFDVTRRHPHALSKWRSSTRGSSSSCSKFVLVFRGIACFESWRCQKPRPSREANFGIIHCCVKRNSPSLTVGVLTLLSSL
jgi:hypothetical protein